MSAEPRYRYRVEFTSPIPAEPIPPAHRREPKPPQPATLSPEQLADYLGCGRTHAYEILRSGAIQSFKVGRLRKVLREDADEYLRRLRDERQGPRFDGSGREQDG
jgi:excisionase family DNA binding protein